MPFVVPSSALTRWRVYSKGSDVELPGIPQSGCSSSSKTMITSTSWIGLLWAPRASDPDAVTSLTSRSEPKAALMRSRRTQASGTCLSGANMVGEPEKVYHSFYFGVLTRQAVSRLRNGGEPAVERRRVSSWDEEVRGEKWALGARRQPTTTLRIGDIDFAMVLHR